MKHEPVFCNGDYLIKRTELILESKNWNWRSGRTNSLVEMWIKYLCVYLDAYQKLYDCELRTDDVDEFQELLWAESQLVESKQVMLEIENIWNNSGIKDGSES